MEGVSDDGDGWFTGCQGGLSSGRRRVKTRELMALWWSVPISLRHADFATYRHALIHSVTQCHAYKHSN